MSTAMHYKCGKHFKQSTKLLRSKRTPFESDDRFMERLNNFLPGIVECATQTDTSFTADTAAAVCAAETIYQVKQSALLEADGSINTKEYLTLYNIYLDGLNKPVPWKRRHYLAQRNRLKRYDAARGQTHSYPEFAHGIHYRRNEIVGVLYLFSEKGAFGLGHVALMLVRGNGTGTCYSFLGNFKEMFDVALKGKYTRAKLAVSLGDVNLCYLLRSGAVTSESFDGKTEREDNFSDYIYMPLDNENGLKIKSTAEQLRREPLLYNLYAFNCNHMAQLLLSAARLNFTPLCGDFEDEKKLFAEKLWETIFQAITRSGALFQERLDDFTIPLAAFAFGKKTAPSRGWLTGDLPLVYKPAAQPEPVFVPKSDKSFERGLVPAEA